MPLKPLLIFAMVALVGCSQGPQGASRHSSTVGERRAKLMGMLSDPNLPPELRPRVVQALAENEEIGQMEAAASYTPVIIPPEAPPAPITKTCRTQQAGINTQVTCW